MKVLIVPKSFWVRQYQSYGPLGVSILTNSCSPIVDRTIIVCVLSLNLIRVYKTTFLTYSLTTVFFELFAGMFFKFSVHLLQQNDYSPWLHIHSIGLFLSCDRLDTIQPHINGTNTSCICFNHTLYTPSMLDNKIFSDCLRCVSIHNQDFQIHKFRLIV